MVSNGGLSCHRILSFLLIDTMESPAKPETLESQALTEHLRELRSCLIWSFLAIIVGSCLAYSVIRPIGKLFLQPLTAVLPEGSSLIFTSYQEGFFFI